MKRNGLRIASVLLMILAIALWNRQIREGLDSPQRLAYAENEGSTVNINAPDGKIISEVLFASYGNPTGSGGDFQKGDCHASTSEQIVKDRCLGKSSCSIPASNDVFGDPCYGTGKRLYVTVNASAPPSSSPTSSDASTTPTQSLAAPEPAEINWAVVGPIVGIVGVLILAVLFYPSSTPAPAYGAKRVKWI